jgi:ankyrin repeat protein
MSDPIHSRATSSNGVPSTQTKIDRNLDTHQTKQNPTKKHADQEPDLNILNTPFFNRPVKAERNLDEKILKNLERIEEAIDNLSVTNQTPNEAIKKLLNHCDSDGVSALMLACKYGRHNLIKKLVEHGADLNAETTSGYTPLMFACMCKSPLASRIIMGFIELDKSHKLSYAINKVNKYGSSPLIIAVKNNNLEISKYLIQKKADIEIYDANGETILMHAVNEGNIEIVKWLLDQKSDLIIDKTDTNRRSALILAVLSNQTEIAKLLISKNANQSIIDCDKKTAFDYAREKENSELIPLFINITNTETGNTRVIDACQKGDLSSLKKLIEEGADLTIANNSAETALTLAIKKNNLEAVKLLIELGKLDINIRSGHQQGTFLHIAIDQNKTEIAKYFIDQNNVEINAKDNAGQTLLHYASRGEGNVEIVKQLLAKNADIELCDNRNRIALTATKNEEIFILLMEKRALLKSSIPIEGSLIDSLLHKSWGQRQKVEILERLEAIQAIQTYENEQILGASAEIRSPNHAPGDILSFRIQEEYYAKFLQKKFKAPYVDLRESLQNNFEQIKESTKLGQDGKFIHLSENIQKGQPTTLAAGTGNHGVAVITYRNKFGKDIVAVINRGQRIKIPILDETTGITFMNGTGQMDRFNESRLRMLIHNVDQFQWDLFTDKRCAMIARIPQIKRGNCSWIHPKTARLAHAYLTLADLKNIDITVASFEEKKSLEKEINPFYRDSALFERVQVLIKCAKDPNMKESDLLEYFAQIESFADTGHYKKNTKHNSTVSNDYKKDILLNDNSSLHGDYQTVEGNVFKEIKEGLLSVNTPAAKIILDRIEDR